MHEDTTTADRYCGICGRYHEPGPCLIPPLSTAGGRRVAGALYRGVAWFFLLAGVVAITLALTVGNGLASTSGAVGAGSLVLAAWGFWLASSKKRGGHVD
ncbi:MAG: hypothetical protein JJ896_14325 [Rhodothermales bacterium]|nr:hypothetical protein [Rhodothermales bacterium]MBO6780826.1 hypothetical protein [Rhodothermales bacterium]